MLFARLCVGDSEAAEKLLLSGGVVGEGVGVGVDVGVGVGAGRLRVNGRTGGASLRLLGEEVSTEGRRKWPAGRSDVYVGQQRWTFQGEVNWYRLRLAH